MGDHVGPSIEVDLRRDLFYWGSAPVPGQPGSSACLPGHPRVGLLTRAGPSRAGLSWAWSPDPRAASDPGRGSHAGRAVDGLAEQVGVPVVAGGLPPPGLPPPPPPGGLLPRPACGCPPSPLPPRRPAPPPRPPPLPVPPR